MAIKKQAASGEGREKAERAATKKPATKAASKRAVKATKPAAARAKRSAARSPEAPTRRAKAATTAASGAAATRSTKSSKGRKARPAPAPAAEASAEVRELALAIAAAGMDKKALGIEILDVTGKVDYADFLVVMTGRSDRHVHAIAVGLEEALRRQKRSPISVEGLTAATWVLLDFGDVVVHVFQEDARRLYDIEGLWIDASRVPVPADATPDDRARAEL